MCLLRYLISTHLLGLGLAVDDGLVERLGHLRRRRSLRCPGPDPDSVILPHFTVSQNQSVKGEAGRGGVSLRYGEPASAEVGGGTAG